MAYRDYKYGCWKKEITQLLRKRIDIKNKIRYHKCMVKSLEKEKLREVELELNNYLKKAGN